MSDSEAEGTTAPQTASGSKFMTFGKGHRTLDLGGFLKLLGLSSFEEEIIEQGAESIDDLASLEPGDVEELCATLNMKMFHKIRLKHGIKQFILLCERYPTVEDLKNNTNRKKLTQEEKEKRRQQRREERLRKNPPQPKLSAKELNDIDQIDITEALVKHGFLSESAVSPNMQSLLFKNLFETHKIYGKTLFSASQLNVYQALCNKAAAICAYHFPDKVALGSLEFRKFVEEIVRISGYTFQRPWKKRPSGAEQRKKKKIKDAIAAGIDPSTLFKGKPGRPKMMNPDGSPYITKRERAEFERAKRKEERLKAKADRLALIEAKNHKREQERREKELLAKAKPKRQRQQTFRKEGPAIEASTKKALKTFFKGKSTPATGRGRSRSKTTPASRYKKKASTPAKAPAKQRTPRASSAARSSSQAKQTKRASTPKRPASANKRTASPKRASTPKRARTPKDGRKTKSPTPAQIQAAKPLRMQIYENKNFVEITSGLLLRMSKDLETAIENEDFENALRLREGIGRAERELVKLKKEKERLQKQWEREKDT